MDIKERVSQLRQSQAIRDAFAFIEADEGQTVEQQKQLALIPAYSNHEEAKAAAFRKIIDDMGYDTVQDEVGNVLALIQGPEEAPTVMVTAHMDTVFPLETKLSMHQEGTRISCPGICDDTRGCAEILAILRTLKKTGIRPACTLLIGGDVGEEGIGNFRGMRHMFNTLGMKVDAYVSIDGTGNDVTYGGVSDVQFRITFRGPGGHSMGMYGLVNPIMCMGNTIARIEKERPPLEPYTIFNVSTVQGGTGVTSIASTCSMTMDVRSADADVMRAFHERCLAIAQACADEEYARWQQVRDFRAGQGSLRFDPDARIEILHEELGGSIGGVQSVDAEIVQILKAASQAAGMEPEMRSLSSTDANIPLSLGIPAAAIPSGGASGGTHDISEWYDFRDSFRGVQKNLLSILALTGIEGVATPLISRTRTR